MTNPLDSIVIITSKDPAKKSDFGTGFVILNDGGSITVITCAHVIDAVGEDSILSDGKPATVIKKGNSDGFDLAIVKVQGASSRTALKPGKSLFLNQEVKILGFYKHGKSRAIRPATGILVEEIKMDDSLLGVRIEAWIFNIQDEGIISEGQSGSPIIDIKSGCVVGVVTTRQGEKQGTAIAIYEAVRIWKDISAVTSAISAIFDQLDKMTNELDDFLTGSSEPSPYIQFKQKIEASGSEIVAKQHGQITQKITIDDLAALSPSQRRHISVLKKSMDSHYKLWTELYPKRNTSDQQRINAEVDQRLKQIVSDMSDDLNGILSFIESLGMYLDDHYMHIRHIVSQAKES